MSNPSGRFAEGFLPLQLQASVKHVVARFDEVPLHTHQRRDVQAPVDGLDQQSALEARREPGHAVAAHLLVLADPIVTCPKSRERCQYLAVQPAWLRSVRCGLALTGAEG